MNPNDLERMLRKAPPLTPPQGLLERLQAGIGARPIPTRSRGSLLWLKRWMPALSFSALMLAGLVLFAVQSDAISKLKQEKGSWAGRPASVKSPTAGKSERISLERQELERLRKENAELQTLRSEADQLRQQIAGLIQIRVANQNLRSELATDPSSSLESALATARQKAESIKCVNNLKNIGLAARIFATDNEDTFPPDFLTITNELSTPKILHCPSDLGKTEAANWSEFSPARNSYEMLLSGLKEEDMEISTIVFRCPTHGHVCLADGSVWQDPERNGAKIVVRNGRQVLVPPTLPNPRPPSFQ